MAEMNSLRQLKIGVLGSNGFLGSTILNELSSNHIDFMGFNRSNYPDIFDFNYLTSLLVDNRITHLINCISYNGYEKCESRPLTAFHVNTFYPQKLALTCRLTETNLIHLSTEAVFQSADKINTISTIPLPSTLYGKTKMCGEVVGPKAITVRLPLLTSRNKNKQIVYKLLELIKDKRRVKVSNDVFTTPIIVEDFAKQLMQFIVSDSYDICIYHASSNLRLSFSEIVRLYAFFFGIGLDHMEEVSEDTFGSQIEKPKSLGLQSNHELLTIEFKP